MAATLPDTATKEEIIALIDQWVILLGQEKYEEALDFLDADPVWTPELLREVITNYGDSPDDRITLHHLGFIIDGREELLPYHQRKEVTWYTEMRDAEEDTDWFDETGGEIWYDLNTNGLGSWLTATFDLEKRDGRIHVTLNDIRVM